MVCIFGHVRRDSAITTMFLNHSAVTTYVLNCLNVHVPYTLYNL